MSRAQRLERVFGIEIETRQSCGGNLGIIAGIAVNSKGRGDEAPATCRSDWQARFRAYPHFPADGAGTKL